MTFPASWLQMIEGSYCHPITEVEIETRDATLIVKPLFNFGFDELKWRTDEDAPHGVFWVASVKANQTFSKWALLLDKIERSGGRFIEDGWEYWRIVSFADLSHDSKLTQIFCGVGRRRLPRTAGR